VVQAQAARGPPPSVASQRALQSRHRAVQAVEVAAVAVAVVRAVAAGEAGKALRFTTISHRSFHRQLHANDLPTHVPRLPSQR
jgi:hypothetical protein